MRLTKKKHKKKRATGGGRAGTCWIRDKSVDEVQNDFSSIPVPYFLSNQASNVPHLAVNFLRAMPSNDTSHC